MDCAIIMVYISFRRQRGAKTMKEKKFYLIEEDVVPEIFIKVLQAKRYVATGKAKNASEAAEMADLSRSAFYKYKDKVLEYRMNDSAVVTLYFSLEDVPGVLSNIINTLYECGANIVTVNQNIPSDGAAPVTISIRTTDMTLEEEPLMERLYQCHGVIRVSRIS